jgi:hypothetical protein
MNKKGKSKAKFSQLSLKDQLSSSILLTYTTEAVGRLRKKVRESYRGAKVHQNKQKRF